MSRQPMQTLTLPITGMSCAACSAYIEQTLNALPGVESASVNLLANQATITSTLPPEALITAIQDAGYDATLPSPELEGVPHVSPLRHGFPQLSTRAFTALTIAAASMLLSMTTLPATPLRYTLLALTLVVMLALSPETYRRAFTAARHRTTNMSTLVAIGTLAALAWSLTATIAPQIFITHGLAPDVYYEAIDFILAFLLLGAWLDSRAKLRTQSALAAFAQLTPSTARVLRNNTEIELPLAALHPGDQILLLPGERIPVDGTVLLGTSTVDESLLTGESIPVLKSPQSPVIGGTINLDGPLTIEATTLGADSVLSQLRRLLSEAQSSRAPMQKLADRASAIFVPTVLALAALTFAAWLLLDHSLPRAFAAAIAVLVIACPCAMGLAVPAALTVGIGRAAQLGILVKNGEALERLAQTRNLALDKTGTLTEGRPKIVAAHFAPNLSPEDHQHLLQLAAALERHSEHPLAKAVQSYIPTHTPFTLTNIKTIPGQGITATYNNQQITIGNEALSHQNRVPQVRTLGPGFPQPSTPTTKLHLTINNQLQLTLEATDTLRESAPQALTQLSTLGITPHILTGDNAATAAAIANLLNIPAAQIHAHLLPADKLTIIQQLQQQAPTAMAGDGINDAAALAQADTGIAISGQNVGTDLTREAADLVLLRPDLTLIPTSIRLARRTTRTMRQNLGWAVAYNLLGLPIAAGALYPHFHILLSPALASAAMALSSISVLFNSLRLRRFE
ncbi:heavy metal translocating P-type ATPase [Granulicella tundricola]|nr:cation-translocating P-type ATPase [Granulicella tundricola]